MARVTGLEITETSVRVVDLDGSPRKYRIAGASEVPIPEGERESPDAVSQAIKAAFKEARAKKDQVVLGIPAREAVIREIVIPFTDPDQIRKVLKFESEGHLHGMEIDDVIVDFHKVSETGARSRLLIIAVRKDCVQKYLRILSKAGIDPQQIDMDAAALFSLSRLITEVEEVGEGGQVILDVGRVNSTVIVSEGAHLRMVRCMRLGSESLVRAISQDLGIEAHEARTVTQQILQLDTPFSAGEEEPGTHLQRTVLEDKETEYQNRLVGEVRRSLSSLQMEGRLSAVWLTGPASTAPGLEHALKQELGVQVAHLDTLQLADHKLPERAELFVGTASGLALKGLGHDPMRLDFRREELRFTRKFEKIQVPLTLAALFLFIGLAFLSINTYLKYRARQEHIANCGQQAINELQKNLVNRALKDTAFREIMGYESIDQVKALVPSIKSRDQDKWVSQVRIRLSKPSDHIQNTFGLEVGGSGSGGPETQVVSALKRVEEFIRVVEQAKPGLKRVMIDKLLVTSNPNQIRWTMRMEEPTGWDVLEKEFAKMKGFEKAERGELNFVGDNLYKVPNCRIMFEGER